MVEFDPQRCDVNIKLSGRQAYLPGFGPKTSAVAMAAVAGRLHETLARLREAGRASLDPAGDRLRAHLKGDLHTHTTWSDGGSPLAEMAAVAEALGHDYIAVTDHSPRLRVANGLSRDRLVAQWEEIGRVQEVRSVRVLRRGWPFWSRAVSSMSRPTRS